MKKSSTRNRRKYESNRIALCLLEGSASTLRAFRIQIESAMSFAEEAVFISDVDFSHQRLGEMLINAIERYKTIIKEEEDR